MGREIERKYLLAGEAWRGLAEGVLCRQGYLSSVKDRIVRVRSSGGRGYLTVKGPSCGTERAEYEYEIPAADAEEMLDGLCEKPLIEKKRHRIRRGGLTWEVDEFLGENSGLVTAEVELQDPSVEPEKPDWIGAEVTGDPRYFNSSLVGDPYKNWKDRR